MRRPTPNKAMLVYKPFRASYCGDNMAENKSSSHDFGPLALAIMVAAVLFSAAFYYSPSKVNYSLSKISSDTESPRLIYANAEASKEVEPDKVSVTLSVVTNGTDPVAIQSENNARTGKVKSALLSLGVPEANIQTVGYVLDRRYEYNKSSEAYEVHGYILTNSINVVSYNVSLAGKIVKAGVSEGANELSGVSFGLTDDSRKAVYAQLLKQAASQAKGKADAMASAAGVGILGLNTMSEGYSITQVLSSYKDGMPGAAPAPQEVSISAGLVKVTATVNAAYEISG